VSLVQLIGVLIIAVPRIQGVVYFTRSLVEMENENVVNSAIEYVTTVQQTKMPFRVSPPLLPLTDLDVEDENLLSGKFLKYLPSNFSSGCFIATITREVGLSSNLSTAAAVDGYTVASSW